MNFQMKRGIMTETFTYFYVRVSLTRWLFYSILCSDFVWCWFDVLSYFHPRHTFSRKMLCWIKLSIDHFSLVSLLRKKKKGSKAPFWEKWKKNPKHGHFMKTLLQKLYPPTQSPSGCTHQHTADVTSTFRKCFHNFLTKNIICRIFYYEINC